MTLAFHQFTSKQTMNWPCEGRYQAELDNFHVCDLQSRPYSGLLSKRAKLLSTLMLWTLSKTTSSGPFRILKLCLFVCVRMCVRMIILELHMRAPVNNMPNPVNEQMDGKQIWKNGKTGQINPSMLLLMKILELLGQIDPTWQNMSVYERHDKTESILWSPMEDVKHFRMKTWC